MGEDVEKPDSSVVRVNWRANQQVAVSKVNEADDGIFALNFFLDDRYFPFEGTGVVSSWRLEIPKETNSALVKREQNIEMLDIEDILIHVRYTSKYEQGAFRSKVNELVKAEKANAAAV